MNMNMYMLWLYIIVIIALSACAIYLTYSATHTERKRERRDYPLLDFINTIESLERKSKHDLEPSDELTRLRNMEKAIKKHPELRRAVQAAIDRDDIKLMLMFHPPVVSPSQPGENKGHSETTDSHADHQQEQG